VGTERGPIKNRWLRYLMLAWFVVVGSVGLLWPIPDWLFIPFLTFIIVYPVVLLAVTLVFRRRGKSASL